MLSNLPETTQGVLAHKGHRSQKATILITFPSIINRVNYSEGEKGPNFYKERNVTSPYTCLPS